MTFYSDHIHQLHKKLYPKDYLLRQVMKAKQYMDKNYAKPLVMNAVAGEAFYSKFHFIRLFRNVYGRTPYQYLRSVRVEKAKKLLQKGQTVTGVCYAVGFNSTTSFTNLFKRMTGRTPSYFQNNKPIL